MAEYRLQRSNGAQSAMRGVLGGRGRLKETYFS